MTEKPYEPLRPRKGRVGELLAPVAGFGVTFSAMFKPAVTEEYPRKKTPPQPRYHGRHQLNRYADGLEKCIGCELCAWACPADAIYVEGGDNADLPDGAHVSPGERYGRVYQINYLRCIFCGLCIEACPTRALTMTNDYELAGPTRAGLIYEKQDLLAPLADGMLAAPHPMAEGTTDSEYYRGEVTAPTEAQVDWVREHRPDDPTLDAAAAVAAGRAPKPTQRQHELRPSQDRAEAQRAAARLSSLDAREVERADENGHAPEHGHPAEHGHADGRAALTRGGRA